MTLRVNETFYSIQGEVDIGKPTIFIRLQGCNIEPKCDFCDSCYSWNEGTEMSYEELHNEIKKHFDKCQYIVFTGGEPMVQIKNIMNFIEYLNEKNKDVTFNYGIETNGLIYSDNMFIFNKVSVSPKKQSYNLDSLNQLNSKDTRYKFVYENKNDLWFEEIIEKLDLYHWQVYIMPQGKLKEEQEELTEEVVEYCKEKGYNFTPRMHVLIWGDKRKK